MGGEADVEGPACCLSRTRRVLDLVSWLFNGKFSVGTAPVLSDFLFPSTKEKKSISITEFIFIYSAQNIVKRKNFNQINYIQ